jgi:protein-tyrosine phosphatase
MRHVFWLRSGAVAGRTGPNTDPWDPIGLSEGGIGTVLSVNSGESVDSQELAAADIDHGCYPFSAVAPPVPGDVEICVAALPMAMDFAQSSIGRGRPVLVHCQAGKDRTGLFMSYFLCQTEGLSPVEAITEVRRVRPIALSAIGWEELALEVLDELVG